MKFRTLFRVQKKAESQIHETNSVVIGHLPSDTAIFDNIYQTVNLPTL
jgi:hypothetical protein